MWKVVSKISARLSLLFDARPSLFMVCASRHSGDASGTVVADSHAWFRVSP